jgi:hypothetical protein
MPLFFATHRAPKSDWEYSFATGLDFYTENPATDYQNGVVFHFDFVAGKIFKNGWELGGTYGWLQQINDDTGPVAEALGGLRGHAMAIGPIARYEFKSGERDIIMSWRVLKEFAVKDRTEGWWALWTTSFKW